ncbi:MAG: glycosyltransferase family 4 protein [bacterium]|nr:glycosyltransferase family 4 protein [bacterium]
MSFGELCLIGFEGVLVKNKTGVGVCQNQVVRALIRKNVKFKIAIAGGDFNSRQLIAKPYNAWLRDHIVFGRELVPAKKSEKLPVELSYGYYPVFLMNDIMYPSILPCRKIAWVHDMMSMIYPQNYTKDSLKQHQILFHNVKYANGFIATSKTTKRDIIKYLHIPPEKITVIYNGVEDKFYSNAEDDILPQSEIDFDKAYYLYIGDMRKNKNLINALKGFERYLSQTSADCYFYIAGNKSHEYASLKKYAENSVSLKDRVVFCGYVTEEEKMALYRRARALLFVSEYEGFGIPILEAMASRIPVVTSDRSSMKEIGQGHAILVDPFSPQSICEGLKMADEKADDVDYIERNYQHARKFTWERATEKFCRLLK